MIKDINFILNDVAAKENLKLSLIKPFKVNIENSEDEEQTKLDSPNKINSNESIFCATEGSTVSYNLPTFPQELLLPAPLTISKNIIINGLLSQKPRIDIDFITSASGFTINGGKTLTLNNVDMKLLFPQGKKSFIGPGSVSILASSKVTQL